MKTEYTKDHPLYVEFKEALNIQHDMRPGANPYIIKCIEIAEEYASQFKPTPSSTVDLEREADELYPYHSDLDTKLIYNYVQESRRKAYIKGRKVSLQEGSDGWISCENKLPTIEDCGQRSKKVAALPHHSDADIEFVYYYNVHGNRHSHWHPINFQLQATSQEGLSELIEWCKSMMDNVEGSDRNVILESVITKATELLLKP